MRSWFRCVCVLGVAVLALPGFAQDEKQPSKPQGAKELKTFKEKLSYGIGLNIGRNLAKQKLDIDPATLAQAIADVLGKKTPALSEDELQDVFQELETKMAEKSKADADKAKLVGVRFLEENGKKEGIKTTKSGLQYKVLRSGKGPTPTTKDSVLAHYKGRLVDGTQFDSSYEGDEPTTAEKPAEFPVTGVIKGWTEALQLMKVGDKWQIYLPSDLAYGPRGAGGDIPPHATLIFDIELVGVKAGK